MWRKQPVTVGADKNGTLVYINFSAQDASILKISVPIIKRRSWGFQNTPNLQNLDYFEPSYSNLKKMEDLQILGSYSILDKQFLCHFVFAVFLANTHQKVDFWGCFGIFRISSCWGDPEDPETPPNINFLMSIDQQNCKKQRSSQNWIRPQFLKIFHFL